jgi:hypothetical protein
MKELIEAIVGPVLAGFWSHLNLPRYGHIKLLTINRGVREYAGEDLFWADMLSADTGRRLKLNDVVKLTGFQLAEWFPRAPGTWWTEQGRAMREAASEHIEAFTARGHASTVYSPKGKYMMVSGGVGTNRLLPHAGESGKYRVLCATSSGICNAGIPVVLLEDVYEAIEEPLGEKQGLEVDLTGRLTELPFSDTEFVLPARGSPLEDTLREYLASTLHVPRYVLLVESSLLVKKYISDFGLRAAAWTLYAQEAEEGLRPSFTFSSFDPRDLGGIERSVDFINEYVRSYGGKIIFTDFDEHVRRLEARHSLAEIMNGPSAVSADLARLKSWGKAVQGYY